MRAKDLQFEIGSGLKELVDNQKTVDELKNTYRQMRHDLGGCRDYVADRKILDRYGINMGGYLSAILGAYEELIAIDQQSICKNNE